MKCTAFCLRIPKISMWIASSKGPYFYEGRRKKRTPIGQRAGEAPTERVTGDGGVQPDTSNDSIRFPGNLYNRQNQNDPRDYIEAAWYIRQDGKQHLKKDYIRHHQRTHTPEHPAPAPEYL